MRLSRKVKQIISGTVLTVLVLLGLAAWGVPVLVRQALQEDVAALLGRTVLVEEVRFNPLLLRLQVSGLSVAQAPAGEAGAMPDVPASSAATTPGEAAAPTSPPTLSLHTLEARLSPKSVWHWAPVLSRLTLHGLRVHVTRTAPARLDVSKMIDQAIWPDTEPDEASEAGGARFSVANLSLTDGEITLVDEVTGRRHLIDQISLGVPFVSNLPSAIDVDVEPRLSARINGRPVALEGTTLPFDPARTSELALRLDGVDLEPWADIRDPDAAWRLRSGLLDMDAVVAFEQPPDAPPKLSVRGVLGVRALLLEQANGAPLFDGQSIRIAGLDAQPLERMFAVERLVADGLAVHLDIPAGDATASARSTGTGRAGTGAPARANAGAEANTAPAESPSAAQTPTAWQWRLGELQVHNSELQVRLAAPDFSYHWREITLLAHDLDSKLPSAAEWELTATGRGVANGPASPARWALTGQAEATASAAGAQTDRQMVVTSQVTLEAVDLRHAQPWWAGRVQAQLLQGQAEMRADLRLELPVSVLQGQGVAPDAWQASWSDASLALTGLQARLPGEDSPSLSLGQLAVQGVSGSLRQRRVSVDAIALEGLRALAHRQPDGSVPWQDALMQPDPAAQRPSGPQAGERRRTAGAAPTIRSAEGGSPQTVTDSQPAASGAWTVIVKGLSWRDMRADLEDRTVEPAARLRLLQAEGQLDNLSWPTAGAMPLQARFELPDEGSLSVQGEVQAQPASARLAVQARGLDLAVAAPYIADRLNTTLASARLDGNGRIEWAGQGEDLQLGYSGSVAVRDLRTLDKVNDAEEFVHWSSAAIEELSFTLAPGERALTASPLTVEDLYARVIINSEGRVNLQDVLRQPGQSALVSITDELAVPGAEAPSEPSSGPAWDLSLGGLRLARGEINFTDNFIRPNFSAKLTDLEGEISALSNADTEPAKVAVAGKVDGEAPLEITGSLYPLGAQLYTDIRATATGIELTRMSTYSAKYAGYGIERGRLSLDVRYQIKDGQLEAQNQIFLDQLTFGERVDSPDATKLPVLLAVALLKNARGEINVNLPVSGSLDAPDFSVGGLIARVVVNLIARAVTAPFALLASAFGGGEELSYIPFAPGGVALDEQAKQRLDTLSKALLDRPGLRLDVSGRADPNQDGDLLRLRWLQEQIRAAKVRDLTRGGQSVDPASVQVSDEERERYLVAAFRAADVPVPQPVQPAEGSADSQEAQDPPSQPPELTVAAMEALLMSRATVTEDSLRQLADQRARVVIESLRATADPARVFLVAPRVGTAGLPEGESATRVDFALR